MTNNLRISIIICTYNRAELLSETLQSLIKEDLNPEFYEIIVVNNNSNDDTASRVGQFINDHPKYNLRLVNETRQGLSYARNRGIEESKADSVVFFDDDIIAGEHLIRNWIRFFDTYPQAAGGGGKILVQFDAPRPNWMPEILLTLFGKHHHGSQIKKYSRGRYPFGGNLAYRKKIFEKAGLFDTNLGRKGSGLDGGEEKELFYRIIRHNDAVIYVPDAYLWHRVGAARLTKDYVKGQAQGIGKSIAVMLEGKPAVTKFKKWISELIKFGVSLAMCAGYFLILRPAKGIMLLRYRCWIWSGYAGYFKQSAGSN